MRSTPLAPLLCALAVAACQDLSSKPTPYMLLNPVLDSLVVGDQSPPPSVTYYDGQGGSLTPAPSEVTWSSTDTTILAVNSTTGRMTARQRGTAVIFATARGVQGIALIVVSNTLDLTLLTDTIYLMPNDTFTVPVAVLKQTAPPPVVWYVAPTNAVFTVDSATGLVTAVATGGPIPYIVHADTIADTGAVSVLSLADTTGGMFFFSVLGTAITHVGGPIRAVNYSRSNGRLAFRLRGTYAPSGTTQQVVQITLPDSVIRVGSYAIDSLSPAEAVLGFTQPAVICDPPRAWALWSAQTPSITGYSRRGGRLGITQLTTFANGQAISGRFFYLAQRTDLYSDPLGVLTVQGTFVAPLVTDRTACK